MKRSTIRFILDKFGIWRVYLFRSHNQWTGMLLSLFNFSVIIFNLFWVTFFHVPEDVWWYGVWIIFFLLFYIPVATFIGYLDMKYGSFRAGQKRWRDLDPIWAEVHAKLDCILEDQGIPKKRWKNKYDEYMMREDN